jgi:hypothetical protein
MKIIGVKFFYTIKEFAEPKEWRQVTILLADMYGQPDLQPQRTNKTRSAEGQVFLKRIAIFLPIRRTKARGQVFSNRTGRVGCHQYLFFNSQWRDADSLDAP